jgi:hypothetical protein
MMGQKMLTQEQNLPNKYEADGFLNRGPHLAKSQNELDETMVSGG